MLTNAGSLPPRKRLWTFLSADQTDFNQGKQTAQTLLFDWRLLGRQAEIENLDDALEHNKTQTIKSKACLPSAFVNYSGLPMKLSAVNLGR